ncbi:hypothetical protein EJB05_15530, partial [Eragrostis curvula]
AAARRPCLPPLAPAGRASPRSTRVSGESKLDRSSTPSPHLQSSPPHLKSRRSTTTPLQAADRRRAFLCSRSTPLNCSTTLGLPLLQIDVPQLQIDAPQLQIDAGLATVVQDRGATILRKVSNATM